MEIGLPHQRQFTIACVIVKYREIGQGKSKKIAKRMAAHKMWTRLQDASMDPNELSTHLDSTVNDEVRLILLKNIFFFNFFYFRLESFRNECVESIRRSKGFSHSDVDQSAQF